MPEEHPILKDLQDYKDLLLKGGHVAIGTSMSTHVTQTLENTENDRAQCHSMVMGGTPSISDIMQAMRDVKAILSKPPEAIPGPPSPEAEEAAKELVRRVMLGESVRMYDRTFMKSPYAPGVILSIDNTDLFNPGKLDWDCGSMADFAATVSQKFGLITPADYMKATPFDRAGWRRYGTKQRPVRANKRRRLAKRYPLGKKCAARQREKLARQKRTDSPYRFGRYSPAILATF